jgi:para-nitrobenzyl esterase
MKELSMRTNISRRELIAGVPTMAWMCAGSGAPARADAPETPIADTRQGRLRGMRENGVLVFKGVAYAGPSDGANRFKPPTPLKGWTGVRDALEYGPQAIQNRDPNAPSTAPVARSSENCHFLNVWTPAVDGRKRPVMFYSHGGGFATGSGGSGKNPSHDGSALARNYDVVVVTHNHRLGLMGYLFLGDILGEEYAASGITGMLDIVAAMNWVRDNIGGFGGDPANVMIWGESGGGAKVSTLLAMPSAHGLFHKASIESGPGLRMIPRDAATETAKALLADLGLSASQARELINVPTARLLEFQAKYPGATRGAMGSFAPVVDGHNLPAHPFDPVAPAISKNIPLIVGTNKDETIFQFEHRPPAEAAEIFSLDEQGLRRRVADALGPKADKTDHVIDVYRRSRPNASRTDLYVAITTAQWMWANAITLAERKVQQNGAPAFMYMFAYESEVPVAPPINYPMKSPHAMEMAFKFDHPDNNPATGKRPEKYQAARNMSEAWATFARHGDPSFDAIPNWPAYDLKTRATMILDAKCRVVNDPFRDERLLWKELG